MKRNRRIIQILFLLITFIGVFVFKGDAERWCPFGGVEALYSYFTQGNMPCSLAVSNFFILISVLLMTILLRRVFCSYMCPIGTISELLYAGGKKIKLAKKEPEKVDKVLSLLKYGALVFILYITYKAGELLFREFDPCYALISRHGKDITYWAYVVLGIIIISSIFLMIPFCRWFCPLGAVLNFFSKFGLTKVRRDENTCIDCAKCAQVCPMIIPVDKEKEVTHARCTSCLDCIDVCPVVEKGALYWGPPKALGKSWSQFLLVFLMVLLTAFAVAGDYLIPIASYVRERGEVPAKIAKENMVLENLTCRGKSNALMDLLTRNDEYAIEGYFKLEAWPGRGKVVITYDPSKTNPKALKEAITEPTFDEESNTFHQTPFKIKGYDPLGLDDK